MLEAGTKIVDRKYKVPMLWKQTDSRLPNSQEMALRRLRSLHKWFLGNSDFVDKIQGNNKYIC